MMFEEYWFQQQTAIHTEEGECTVLSENATKKDCVGLFNVTFNGFTFPKEAKRREV